jgi:hypothetical protein
MGTFYPAKKNRYASLIIFSIKAYMNEMNFDNGT